MSTPLASLGRTARIAALVGATIFTVPAFAAAHVGAHGAVPNAEGGVTAGSVHGGTGPNGGSAARGRVVKTDGQGDVTSKSGAVVKGANGGTAQTTGTFSHSADGSNSGTRTTSATGAAGNGYTGSSTLANGQVSHSGSCTNASGAVIACPHR